ncbi:hypothetical protein [Kineococcus sp. SYSU DK018]|uniref:hypothetical protein n=1 Tax=Kineococcus sp. SYSU DK018 TaxID=3383139 RepID=UPI003D7EB8A0
MSHPQAPARPRRAGFVLATIAVGLLAALIGCTAGFAATSPDASPTPTTTVTATPSPAATVTVTPPVATTTVPAAPVVITPPAQTVTPPAVTVTR